MHFRKSYKGKSSSKKIVHKHWLDFVFLKRFSMFGDNRGWRQQPYTMILYILLCLQVDAAIQGEQQAKQARKAKKK